MPKRPTESALEAAELLVDLGTERSQVEDRIHRQALTVLDLGGSWTTVADALGISKQAAWERYHRRDSLSEMFKRLD